MNYLIICIIVGQHSLTTVHSVRGNLCREFYQLSSILVLNKIYVLFFNISNMPGPNPAVADYNWYDIVAFWQAKTSDIHILRGASKHSQKHHETIPTTEPY